MHCIILWFSNLSSHTVNQAVHKCSKVNKYDNVFHCKFVFHWTNFIESQFMPGIPLQIVDTVWTKQAQVLGYEAYILGGKTSNK